MKKTLTTKDQSKSNDKANDKNPNPKKLEPSKKYKQLTFFDLDIPKVKRNNYWQNEMRY